ncbi:hypothetical protein [Spirochaeta isovalerica]|uniref:Lipoprotein n=1 Tax=Spirochaeta isovalerica TaxID=150 RepID=A0A841R603_9SPIO|nr:hypothetical protein [Spirochaeta isovalerica]MBB6478811.1 hypothetical protein [Spirochaeta isovalerica]
MKRISYLLLFFFFASCRTIEIHEDPDQKSSIENEDPEFKVIPDSDITPPVIFVTPATSEIFPYGEESLFSPQIIYPRINHDLLPLDPFLRIIELKKRYFTDIPLTESPFRDNTVTAVLGISEYILAGTLRGGLYLIDDTGSIINEILKPLNSLYNRSVSDIFDDADNHDVYIGTYSGLYQYSLQTNRLTLINGTVEDKSVTAITLIDGSLFWSTARGVLIRNSEIAPENTTEIYRFQSGVKRLLNYRGHLLAGLSDGRIMHLKTDGTFEQWISLDDLLQENTTINDMIIFREKLYLMTDRGLIIMNPDGEIVQQILTDMIIIKGTASNKNIYVATHSSGIVIYDTISEKWSQWGLKAGLPSLNIPAIGFFKGRVVLSIPNKGILLIDEELQEKL